MPEPKWNAAWISCVGILVDCVWALCCPAVFFVVFTLQRRHTNQWRFVGLRIRPAELVSTDFSIPIVSIVGGYLGGVVAARPDS